MTLTSACEELHRWLSIAYRGRGYMGVRTDKKLVGLEIQWDGAFVAPNMPSTFMGVPVTIIKMKRDDCVCEHHCTAISREIQRMVHDGEVTVLCQETFTPKQVSLDSILFKISKGNVFIIPDE